MSCSSPLKILIPLLILVFLSGIVPAQVLAREIIYPSLQCTTVFENGAIHWSTGKITVTGSASVAPEDKGKKWDTVYGEARAGANRNMIDIFKHININNQFNVGTYASGRDVIMAGIEKTARDAVITKQIYASNGDLELTVETSIFGGFLQLILPDDIRHIPEISDTKPVQDVSDRKPPYVFQYTGLIIDARELVFPPVLYPTIQDEQGNEIYTSAYISREYAVQKGIVKYLCDMNEALKDERVGFNPLVVKALRTGDLKKSSTIVITMSDTHEIEKAVERHFFFKECRVIIVLSQG